MKNNKELVVKLIEDGVVWMLDPDEKYIYKYDFLSGKYQGIKVKMDDKVKKYIKEYKIPERKKKEQRKRVLEALVYEFEATGNDLKNADKNTYIKLVTQKFNELNKKEEIK